MENLTYSMFYGLDKLAGQNTLTALSHTLPPLLVDY